MISVEEALKTVLDSCKPLGLEKVNLLEAQGRVIGEDIIAARNIPSAANSAKDGYAVRTADIKGARPSKPVELRVTEIIAAGSIPRKTVKKGQAARIMTGAIVPKGADAVVCREDTVESDKTVLIKAPVSSGLEIRPAGEDVQKDERVFPAGTALKPAHVGMLAMLGRPFVSVCRQPRVAILSTGEELVEIETDPPAGKFVNSNSYSLAALVKSLGGIPMLFPIVRDTKQEIIHAFGQARCADVILSTGGVSMGDFDFVKDVMSEAGNTLHFWRVAMRPGKPLAFGAIGGTPLFGLPGNPVSAMVTFEQFVRPYLLKMQGHTRILRQTLKATCAQDLHKGAGVKNFLRAVVAKEKGRYSVRLTGAQGSGVLTSMIHANAFIVLDESVTAVKKGEKVTVQMLDSSLL